MSDRLNPEHILYRYTFFPLKHDYCSSRYRYNSRPPSLISIAIIPPRETTSTVIIVFFFFFFRITGHSLLQTHVTVFANYCAHLLTPLLVRGKRRERGKRPVQRYVENNIVRDPPPLRRSAFPQDCLGPATPGAVLDDIILPGGRDNNLAPCLSSSTIEYAQPLRRRRYLYIIILYLPTRTEDAQDTTAVAAAAGGD